MHPCMKCGACCASYRVSFHWSETLEESIGVPASLTVPISPHLSAMKSDLQDHKRCIALDGQLGEQVACHVYAKRPSCCRNFKASYENGVHDQRCDEARSLIGLPPLLQTDWLGC